MYENLMMGAYSMKNRGDFKADLDAAFQRFPRLAERRNQIAGTLSGGEQQMLAMGRALMSHPKLLMLDEPSMGLAPILVDQIFDIVRELHAAGTTVLLVEQNASKALAIADRAYVLETGRITLAEGKYHQIKRMMEALHNQITYLERISFGPLALPETLARGEWRELDAAEEAALREAGN